MSSYGVTSQGSQVIRRITVPDEVVDPCKFGHIWNLNARVGEDLECMICGARFGPLSSEELLTLRENVMSLAEERKKTDD